jgi:hypothetical protein
MTNPAVYGSAIAFGAACGYSELFFRGKRVPAPARVAVKRGAPGRDVGISFGCCLIYAAATTIYVFGAGDEKQYFLASAAAIQTLANILR